MLIYILPRSLLHTVYQSFIRTHLENRDIIYNQTYNAIFEQKLESIRYNSALARVGGRRGTSEEKLCNELGLENLEKRRWYMKVWCF